jgi:hypothetical protein
MKYTKNEAIIIANEFIQEVNKLEKKYNMKFNSDTGDIYFSFESTENGKYWDTISLGWNGDNSGIKVIEAFNEKEKLKQSAIAKLTDEERKALGI